MHIQKNMSRGFTLIEVLLVVAAIAILAGIVILAINPSKQLGDTRNAQRKADVNTILNAVYQYAIDNNGTLPSTITTATTSICMTSGSCSGLIDLSVLTNNQKYVVSMPYDPASSTANDTGYKIVKNAYNRVTVIAPWTESTTTLISATR